VSQDLFYALIQKGQDKTSLSSEMEYMVLFSAQIPESATIISAKKQLSYTYSKYILGTAVETVSGIHL